MKSFEEIYADIKNRFSSYTNQSITENSVMDFYTVSIADVYEIVYGEIEAMRNPHLYTKLKEQSLDDLGFFMNMPRYENESDGQYLYRLMNWRYTVESSNETAINNALLNVKESSDARYIPQTNGSGTASVYIIPTEYTNEQIAAAIMEAKTITEEIVSGAVYVEYVVPDETPIKIEAGIVIKDLDPESVKRQLFDLIKEYVNRIPPESFLEIGEINSIVAKSELASYFHVLNLYVDDVTVEEISVYQPLDYKFLLDEIVWWEEV